LLLFSIKQSTQKLPGILAKAPFPSLPSALADGNDGKTIVSIVSVGFSQRAVSCLSTYPSYRYFPESLPLIPYPRYLIPDT
jgi:hypothetical protein